MAMMTASSTRTINKMSRYRCVVMTTKYLPFLFLSMLTLESVAYGADVPTTLVQQAASPLVSLDPAVDPRHGRMKFRYGAFLYADTAPGALPPTFDVLGSDGHLMSSVTLAVPGASSYFFGDFDRSPDGTIVFAGGSYSSVGEAAPFLVWLSPDGKQENVVSTTPYFPISVSVAPDGTVWTLGHEMINHNSKAAGLDPGAGVLRHFDKSGKLIQSIFPQSGFRTQKQLARINFGRIFVSADRIYWFTAGSDDVSYAEISTSTFAQQTYPGVPVSSGPGIENQLRQILGVTVTDNGTAYLSLNGYPAPYVRDSGSAQWFPVQFTSGSKIVGRPRLIGANGNEVLFQSGSLALSFSSPK
jgi:hypothetical protein